MKKMKKLFSLVMALAMVMSLTVAANAAEAKGNITIQNPEAGKDYAAYQIFDLAYSGTNYAYTIKSDSPWKTTVETYFTLTPSAVDSTVLVAVVKDDFDPAAFAKALNEVDRTGITATATGTGVEGQALVLETGKVGYFFVTSGLGSLCNLTNTDPTATIYDKNDKPTIEKTVNDQDKTVYVGQELTYTIKGKIPSTTGYKTYTYKIADTMSAGLTFKKDTAVAITGINADEIGKYVKITNNDTGFEVTIDVMKLQDYVGNEITVTYKATVNDSAVAVVSKNDAKLTYSNDPTTNETGESKSTVDVISSKIVIDKYAVNKDNKDDKSAKLDGAKFVLQNGEGDYYKYDETAKVVSWVARGDATVVETKDGGKAEFKGLENGTYKLIETEAPEGYNLLTTPTEVPVDGTQTNYTYTAEVGNSTGLELPETGGIGTTIFTVVGGVLMVGAAVLFITKKRSED